jgi:hypothetical protein
VLQAEAKVDGFVGGRRGARSLTATNEIQMRSMNIKELVRFIVASQ